MDENDNAPMLTEAVADMRGAVAENVVGADTGIALRLTDADSAGVNDLNLALLALMFWTNRGCLMWLRMPAVAVATDGGIGVGL